jgi:hypothetical protein
VSSDRQSEPVQVSARGQVLFAQIIRYALAPTILAISGFVTANFLVSGQYGWPRTSRVLALTLTLLVLSYEFVYKEQVAATGSGEQGRSAVVYACVIPYAVGAVLMFALWKL